MDTAENGLDLHPRALVLLYSTRPEAMQALRGLLDASGLAYEAAESEAELFSVLGRSEASVLLIAAAEQEGAAELDLLGRIKDPDSPHNQLPVVLLYPEGTENAVAMASLSMGAYDYLVEPCNEIQLLTKVTVLAMLKHNELEYRALTVRDRLTGLYDRRYIQLRLCEEISRARRHKVPLACVMLDVDCLRAVNESYGSDAGDQLLSQLAEGMNNGKRGSDVLARFGSDSFVMLLWNTDSDGARVVASRIRGLARKTSCSFDTKYQPSMSAGISVLSWEQNVSQLEDPVKDDSQVFHLLDRAEDCLKSAQLRGGDAVVCDGEVCYDMVPVTTTNGKH
ncbi:diguanylate cyclase [bacterium]|nr:diguanylate cyclase [bacterium]